MTTIDCDVIETCADAQTVFCDHCLRNRKVRRSYYAPLPHYDWVGGMNLSKQVRE